MVVLVSKKWMSIGEDPSLWMWFIVIVRTSHDIDMLSIRRIQHTREIYLVPSSMMQPADWEALFRVVLDKLPRLKEIKGLCGEKLWSVKPGLFGMALSKLKVVDLCFYNITSFQIQELFTSMSHNCQLKSLNIESHKLSSVEPGRFARAVSKLETVNLSGARLTNRQLRALFKEMSQDSQLKKVNLRCCNNLSLVEPGLFARVVIELEDVDLYGSGLSNDQKQALFAIITPNSKLKKLEIDGEQLSCIEPSLLSRAVTRLENVVLSFTELTNSQQVALFNEMVRNSRLKSLELFGVDLSLVDPHLLARAVATLESVNLGGTDITTNQIIELFRAICQDSCPLKKLNLFANNLSEVEPDFLAAAVVRLEEVDLQETELSTNQLTSILAYIQEGITLKTLSLRYMDISDVDEEVVMNATEVLGDGPNNILML